jgi:hypothetical protein
MELVTLLNLRESGGNGHLFAADQVHNIDHPNIWNTNRDTDSDSLISLPDSIFLLNSETMRNRSEQSFVMTCLAISHCPNQGKGTDGIAKTKRFTSKKCQAEWISLFGVLRGNSLNSLGK